MILTTPSLCSIFVAPPLFHLLVLVLVLVLVMAVEVEEVVEVVEV